MSYNYICVLCINESEFHPGIFMSFGGYCLVVICAPCAMSVMSNGGTEREYFAGATGSGALGCADAPGGAFTFVGGSTICFVLAFP